MAIIKMTADTKKKTLSVNIDGKKVLNVNGVHVSNGKYSDGQRYIDVNITVTSETNDGIRKETSYYVHGKDGGGYVNAEDNNEQTVQDMIAAYLMDRSGKK